MEIIVRFFHRDINEKNWNDIDSRILEFWSFVEFWWFHGIVNYDIVLLSHKSIRDIDLTGQPISRQSNSIV